MYAISRMTRNLYAIGSVIEMTKKIRDRGKVTNSGQLKEEIRHIITDGETVNYASSSGEERD